MSLNSVKIFLCITISLTICQCIQSQFLEIAHPKFINIPPYYFVDKESVTIDANGDKIIRVAGGRDANLGDFPYMAVVHNLLGSGSIAQCGGSILSKRWVLTAAHCVEGRSQRFHVIFGVIDKSGIGYDFIRGRGVSMIATQTFIHPQYRKGHNDIALIYLPQDIPFSSYVYPIKLACQGTSFMNKQASVIGWGKDRNESSGSKRLKFATLPVIDNNKCRKYWLINNKHVCTAEGTGQDACQGDSGGPLVAVNRNGDDVQIGIVSYGDGFCPSNYPGVFTRVSSYRDWIYQITKLDVCSE